MDSLRKPAGMISANWAGLLALLTVVGALPGLAGVLRVTDDLEERADEAFTSVWRHVRRTWVRDLPVSLGSLAYLVSLAGTGSLLLDTYDGSTRVFFVGLLVPVYWVVGALLMVWVRVAAQHPDAGRGEVVDATVALALRHPLRTLAGVPLFVVVSPCWLVAPVTIACGLSLPSWAFSRFWEPAVGPLHRTAAHEEDLCPA